MVGCGAACCDVSVTLNGAAGGGANRSNGAARPLSGNKSLMVMSAVAAIVCRPKAMGGGNMLWGRFVSSNGDASGGFPDATLSFDAKRYRDDEAAIGVAVVAAAVIVCRSAAIVCRVVCC